MTNKLEEATQLIENKIYQKLDKIFKEIHGQTPEYQILIWGSVTNNKNRTPNDLDIIIEHNDKTLTPDKEKSIQSYLENTTHTTQFDHIDCTVTHKKNTPKLINNSRTTKTYNVNKNQWQTYD